MNRIVTAVAVGSAILIGATGCNSGHSHSHTYVPAPAQTHIHIHPVPTTGKRNVVRTPSRPRTGSGITRGRVSTTKRGR